MGRPADDVDDEMHEYYLNTRALFEDNGIDPDYFFVRKEHFDVVPRLEDGTIDYEEIEAQIIRDKDLYLEIAAENDAALRGDHLKYRREYVMPEELKAKLQQGFTSEEELEEWVAKYPELRHDWSKPLPARQD